MPNFKNQIDFEKLNSNSDIINFEKFDNDHQCLLNLQPDHYFGLSRLAKFDFGFCDNCTLIYPVISSLAYYDICSEKISSYYFFEDDSRMEKFYFFKDHMVCLNSSFEENQHIKINLFDTASKRIDSSFSPVFHKDFNVFDLTMSTDQFRLAILLKNSKQDFKLSIWSLYHFDLTCELDIVDAKPPTHLSFYLNDISQLLLFFESKVSSFAIHDQVGLILNWNFEIDSVNIVSHSWLNGAQLFIGDNVGQIHLFDVDKVQVVVKINVINDLEKIQSLTKSNGYKSSLNLNFADYLKRDIDNDDEEESHKEKNQSLTNFEQQKSLQIKQIVNLSNGLFCAVLSNRIVIYHLNLLNDYRLRHVAMFESNLMTFL